ncbi:MAG: FIG00451076: hypothetical protein, partial [uncultured Sphingosinicella sp.]
VGGVDRGGRAAVADRAHRALGRRKKGNRGRREGRLRRGQVARLRHEDDAFDRAPSKNGEACSRRGGSAAGDVQERAGARL